jgi:serine/threonine protein kinase
MLEAAHVSDSGSTCDIPGHEIRSELGKGGMGAVYLGVRNKDQRHVAIKILLAKIAVSKSAREKFLREVRVTEQLRHQHIVRFLSSGGSGSTFFLVMEYCSAGSLENLLARHGGKLSLRKAKPIMLHCLEGLAYAHRSGFVHRDLKPQNILLHHHDGRTIAKIGDFGLAKSFASAGLSGMTATGNFGGTLPFMPREQLTDFKYARPVSDIWSLAATFYLLLTGKHPRESDNERDPVEVVLREEAVSIRHHDPVVPAPVAAVIDQALKTRAEDRFQTAGEMKTALLEALKLGG